MLSYAKRKFLQAALNRMERAYGNGDHGDYTSAYHDFLQMADELHDELKPAPPIRKVRKKKAAKVAHSKSEYKRLVAQGVDVFPPELAVDSDFTTGLESDDA